MKFTSLQTTRKSCVAFCVLTSAFLTIAGCQSLKSKSSLPNDNSNTLTKEASVPAPLQPEPDSSPDLSDKSDPYRWLEQIESKKALSWARDQSVKANLEISARPQYAKIEAAYTSVLLSKDRIATPRVRGAHIYNFWQDENHVRGIWRRTSFSEYRNQNPEWDTLIDIDALALKENRNWVFRGVHCLPQPSATRCLVQLSNGGKDATTIREFDLKTRAFVANGFQVGEAKSNFDWIDENHLFIATYWGENSLTESGYPRVLKIWKRGDPLEKAETVFEGDVKDVSVSSIVFDRPEAKYLFIRRAFSIFDAEYLFWNRPAKPVRVKVPRDANLMGVFKGEAFFLLRTDWPKMGSQFKANTLISYRLDQTNGSPSVIMSANAKGVVRDLVTTPRSIFVSVLENVRGRIYILDRNKRGAWSKKKLRLPDVGTLDFVSADPQDEPMIISYQSFLSPETLYWFQFSDGKAKPELLKKLPSQFDSGPFQTEQLWVNSVDAGGVKVKVPYFIVRKNGKAAASPTLLTAYGGFEISARPFYVGALGKAWLEQGGNYVVANIRGGGEFGPTWHQAAVGPLRQYAFQDLIAVAKDLVDRGYTTPAQLGIEGGSNGGLLVSAVAVQRPELFGAVVANVPLTDMYHYHEWLAGASWMAEYGDPRVPADLAVLKKYSPYQNLKAGVHYPPMFITSSTRDDRVSPAHARKFAARLSELGQPVLYYENEEGGHAAAANIPEKIHMNALETTFLWSKLSKK